MGKLKFTFSNIFYWLGIIASCLVLENVSFLSKNTKGMSDVNFYLLFAFAFICFISYFVLDILLNKTRVDYVLLGILLFGLISAITATWVLKDFTISGILTYDFKTTVPTKIRQSFSILIFFLSVYASIFVFNKNYPSIRKISVIYVVLILLGYIAIIYSLIKEIDVYRTNLSMDLVASPRPIYSFFWSENMFSGTLLMGMLGAFGLNYFKKNFFSYFTIAVFFIEIILIGSLTSVIVAMCSLFIYVFIEIFLTFRKSTTKGMILLTIYLCSLVAIFLFLSASLQFDIGFISKFFRYIYSNFEYARYSTLSFRTYTWSYISDYLFHNPLQLIFGVGYSNSDTIIAGFWHAFREDNMPYFSAHSGYMQIFINFGIVGLMIYGSFVIYYFYSFVRLFKKDTRFALIYLLIGMSMFAYAVMESVFLFNPNAQGLLVGIIFFLPMVNKYKHLKHNSFGTDTFEVEKPSLIDKGLLAKSLGRIFIGLIAISLGFFIFPEVRNVTLNRYLVINVAVLLTLFYLVLPFVISTGVLLKSRIIFLILTVFNVLLVCGLSFVLMYHYYSNPSSMSGDSKWILTLPILIVLLLEFVLTFIYSKRSFVEYLKCLVGSMKISFMGIIGVVVGSVITYFFVNKIMIEPLTLIIYGGGLLLLYYVFNLIIPFKDSLKIYNHYNNLGVYSLKKEVIKDRLEAINE